MCCDKIIDIIVNNKNFSYGIAIVGIILTHINMVNSSSLWIVFYPGFLGVDLFMFFGGYGLCYSYSKNTLKHFYFRRMVRIMPQFLFMSLIISLLAFFSGNKMTVWDWICNTTSLNYYRLGGFYIEWYLCFLIILYLLFPLLYKLGKIISSKKPSCFVLLLLICVAIAVLCKDEWQYICAVGRTPVFLLGVILFFNRNDIKQYLFYFLLLSILSVALLIRDLLPTYYLLYMLAPFVIGIVAFACNLFMTWKAFSYIVEWMGQHSLDIYVGNIIICTDAYIFSIWKRIILSYRTFNHRSSCNICL